MLQTLIKYLMIVLLSLNLMACNYDEKISRRDFVEMLIEKSGFEDNYEGLINYGVLNKNDIKNLDDNLDYPFVYYALANLVDNNNPDVLIEKGIIKQYKNGEIKKNELLNLIDDVVYYINHQEFSKKFNTEKYETIYLDDYRILGSKLYTEQKLETGDLITIDDSFYKINDAQEDYYLIENAKVEDLYRNINFSYSDDINFEDVEILDNQSANVEKIDYHDDLKRKSDEHFANVKEINGFRISYSFTANSLYFYVSHKIGSTNAFFNTRISHLRPSIDWDYDNGVIKHAYFKLNYDTNESFGLSNGKYKRLYADFNQFKEQDALTALSNIFKNKNEEIESSLTICKFKLPIPELPAVNIICDLKLNFYLSGRVGISIETLNKQGLEINNNQLRLINDNEYDCDGFAQANASTTISFATALALGSYKLIDFKTVAGVKLKLKTTAHLKDKVQEVDVNYDVANEILEAKGIPVCGDVLFYWVLDLILNSSETLAFRLGLHKEFNILDQNNQIFHNKSHIENGLFVDHCTRKLHHLQNPDFQLDASEIILNNYAIVLRAKQAKIEVLALPRGYHDNDIVYSSGDNSIASVSAKGVIIAQQPGATKIRVATKDNKYEVYVNVLVSNYQTTTSLSIAR